jgi:amino-acid N-acetyltransferase
MTRARLAKLRRDQRTSKKQHDANAITTRKHEQGVAIPTITPALRADLQAILDLLERATLPRVGLEPHLGTALVAREDGGIVGSAVLELYGRAALLRSVAVAPERQGQGLGQALTTAALELARQRGVRTVYLLTETAARFFPKFGFQAIDRADVDRAVLGSTEFTTACPASALVMAMSLA